LFLFAQQWAHSLDSSELNVKKFVDQVDLI
jgi:hypothetical protein